MAKGEYIGIVETDDCIEPDMYEVLYQTAVEKNLDYVKAGFYTLVTPYEGEQYLLENPLGDTGQIFSSQYFMEKLFHRMYTYGTAFTGCRFCENFIFV